MSLDVYLELEGVKVEPVDEIIPIRVEGRIKNISLKEWNDLFPDREPVIPILTDNTDVYSGNITHNLSRMADEAGICEYMWEPEEVGVERAEDLIKPLTEGLAVLKSDPVRFKKFNPKNGWGTYEGLVQFVEEYLSACTQYPEGKSGHGDKGIQT